MALNINTDKDIKLLEPCWVAGNRKHSATNFVKLLAPYEIETVDVVKSCNRISELIAYNQADGNQNNALETRSKTLLDFKNFAQLTFGANYILSKQATTLLADARQLLDQLEGVRFDCDVVALPSKSTGLYRCHKRVTTTTTVCVATKRARITEPQLLDDQHVDYYRNMLTESQLWNTTNSATLQLDESQTIQLARTSKEEQIISVSQELTLAEIDQDKFWNEGFGESIQDVRNVLDEFLPIRNSLKRKSSYTSASDSSCKLSRLAENEMKLPNVNVDSDANNLTSNNDKQAVHHYAEIENSAMPLPSLPSTVIVKLKRRKKRKLQKDICIELSREMLLNDRLYYNKKLKSSILKWPKLELTKSILTHFRLVQLFPDCLKTSQSDQNELHTESTIRTIFGIEYSDVLTSAILCALPKTPQHTTSFEHFAAQPILSLDDPETNLPYDLNRQEYNNMNNNVYENSENYVNLDSFSIMTYLLGIWRNNPATKSIDANKFIKSFPDRIKAALAFSHLLSLTRDGFIKLSTKPHSLEIEHITLGPESMRLIEKIWQS